MLLMHGRASLWMPQGLTTAGGKITKGGTEFGEVTVSKGFTAATATYSVGGVPVYTAEKYTTLYYFMTLLQEGKMVGKCQQPGMNTKVNTLYCGAGVDMIALLLTATAVAVATGSGGAAAGALAGAGVH